jgi:hypothetical protein
VGLSEVSKEYKLDIFELLDSLNKKDLKIWDRLTPEQRKAFAPIVVERWMAGTQDKAQIVLINELVNSFVFELADHPQLLMQLLAVANRGERRRYQWIGMKASKKSKHELTIKVIRESTDCTVQDANEYMSLLSAEDIIESAEKLGWQKEELAALKKELK